MRRGLGILLLSILFVPLAGTYALLRYERHQARRAAKRTLLQQMPEANLTAFRFARTDAAKWLRWEHAAEFEYQGNMFDVVRKTETTDSIFLWCWWDRAETQAKQQMRQFLANLQPDNRHGLEHKKRVACFFLSLYFEETPTAQGRAGPAIISAAFPALTLLYCLKAASPAAPPPWRA